MYIPKQQSNTRSLKDPTCSYFPVSHDCFISTAKVEQIKFDATSMHARPDLAAQQKMVDDGSGEAEVSKTVRFINLNRVQHRRSV